MGNISPANEDMYLNIDTTINISLRPWITIVTCFIVNYAEVDIDTKDNLFVV